MDHAKLVWQIALDVLQQTHVKFVILDFLKVIVLVQHAAKTVGFAKIQQFAQNVMQEQL